MFVKIIKLHPDASIPVREGKDVLKYSLFTIEERLLYPGEAQPFRTGIALVPSFTVFGFILPNPTLYKSKKVIPIIPIDIIDFGEEKDPQEIVVILTNVGDDLVKIEKGTKIAQLVFTYALPVQFIEIKKISQDIQNT